MGRDYVVLGVVKALSWVVHSVWQSALQRTGGVNGNRT